MSDPGLHAQSEYAALPPLAVRNAIAARGLVGAGAVFAPMRGGQTNRVWRVQDQAARDYVLKVYAPQAGTVLFPNDPRAEASMLRARVLSAVTPEFVSLGDSDGVMWMLCQHVSGTHWRRDTPRVAQLLTGIHQTPCPDPMRTVAGGSKAVLAQGHDLLRDVTDPSLRQALTDAAPRVAIEPAETLCLIHGDPVPGNILCTANGLIMIDWQCPALGDPVEDLAIFLSPAMQQIYRGTPLDDGDIDAFLSAYDDRNVTARYEQMKAHFHWRMACYCANRVALGKQDYAVGLQLEATQLGLSDIGQL